MAVCPTCGAQVPDGVEECTGCGQDLKNLPLPAPEVVSPPGVPVPASPGVVMTSVVGRSSDSLPPVGAKTGNTGKVGSGNTGRVPPATPSGKNPIVTAAPAMPSGSHPAMGAAPAAATPSGKSTVAPGSAVLTVRRNGGASGETFRVEGGLAVLGRFDPETGPVDVDLGRLPEAGRISRRHAELRWDEATGKWIIRDLGAGNGTFIRPKGETKFRAVQGEQPLADGDEIGLGTARFEFRAG